VGGSEEREAPQPPVRERFHADVSRYLGKGDKPSRLGRLAVVLRNEPLWALATFRFGQYLREEASAPVRVLCKVPYALAHRAMELGLGIHLFPETQVGPGLYIGHYGGIWVSPHAVLGAHCNLNHEATIGCAGEGEEAPRLGDRVWVGPNATITGPVKVGSGAVVAANSLVVASVPDNAVAIGVPARVMSYTGSARLLEPRSVQVGPGVGPNRVVAQAGGGRDPLRPTNAVAEPEGAQDAAQ
jgi:serine O-acetyltransferase